jgi:hypothetical protein
MAANGRANNPKQPLSFGSGPSIEGGFEPSRNESQRLAALK